MSTITPNYTYIYYDVVDYTNSNVLSSYTLSNTPLTFIPDFTTSSVLSGATNISNKTLHWDFGDGSSSTELNPTHHYQWPGIYNVTLTIFDSFGNAYDSTYSATVQIFNYISTQIAFQDYKSLIYDIPVGKLIDPLTINTYFSWQDYPALSAMGYTINLYASGARGAYNYIPQTRLDKWSHLRTLSRFYTLSTINGNIDYVTIESIQPTVTEIYANIQNNQLQRCNATDPGSVLTGVTGSCQFWYTDDIPTNLLTESSPIIIFASIDNSKFNDAFTYRTNAFDYISYPPQGFQNIDPAVFASVKTRYNPADHLSITTTGIDGEGTPVDHTFDIPPISWQDTEIPYVIKFKDSEDFTTKNYPPLSSSVVQNPSITPQLYYDVQTDVVVYNPTTTYTYQVTSYEPNTLPDNLLAYWTLDDSSWSDSTGNGYTLTNNGGVANGTGIISDGAVYNGSGNYLSNNSFTLGGRSAFTISVWVKYDNADYANTSQATIVGQSGPSGGGSNIANININPPYGGLFYYINGDENAFQSEPFDYGDNNWHHLVLTYDGSTIVFYVDGSIVDSNSAWLGNLANIDTFWGIGGDEYTSVATPPDASFWGSIDETGVWSRALSEAEVTSLYNNGIGLPYTDFTVGTIIYTTLSAVSGGPFILDGVKFYEDFSSQVPQSIGAFYKGYFIASQSTENCYLTASVNVKDQPYYLKDTLINWITIPQYDSAIRVLRQENINGYNNLTTITFSNSAKFNINANNVYALAVAPSGAGADNDYQTWFADPVGDQILKYDIYGNLLTTYQLSAMVTLVNNQTSIVDYRYPFTLNSLSAASPNDLTLDRKNNLWASLIDSGVVIKLDTASGLVTTIASPTTATNVTTLSSDYNSLSGFAGEDLYLPSSIDTDIDNNLWVAYTHPDYSALIKYQGENNFTTTATILTSIIFPSGISPEQIQIDRNSNVWVTAINHNSQGIGFSNRNDYLYKFDISGNLISGFPLSGFQQIGNLTIDGNQNAWVIQGAETLTKIDGVTKQTTNYIAGLGNNTTNYICSIGGITCDTSNDIWVINNFDKNLYVFDANLITTDVLNPKYTLPLTYPTTGLPVISSYTTPINVANNQYGYSDGLKEFQAYGDWNGYNWLNKYAAPVSTIRTITGASNLFNIYPSTGQYNIAKVNENWNAAGFYDSLRYQETLLDKQVFFDQFLGAIVGGLDAQPYELGKTVYEKIANFVNNNADISKANINELISFCQELTVEFDQYNLTLPPQLRRLVDLLSIKQSTLWGNNNKFTQNFNTQGTIISNSTYGVNLGSQIDPLTGVFTNGTPIVAQELFSDNFKLINNNLIAYYNTDEVIPLSSYIPDWGWGLVVPDTITGTQINNFYKFYNYNPVFNNTYYDNVINWNDPYTTLSPTNSSYSNWSSDSGIVQSLLSYELTMGLRLFTSAANITYNS